MSVTRRNLLGTGLALAAARPAAARWEDVTRYPDPAFEILDPSFARYRLDAAAVERLYTGARWSEGPVWFGDGRFLLWSDIPNDRILRWHETTGQVDEFRKPAGFTNGLARDRQGRLVACEHGGRRISRTETDGRITAVCDGYAGKRLNSPNDVAVASDGSIWFTDPPFGILGLYEGHRAEPELPTNIYRVDGRTGEVAVASGDVRRPNGLAFSPDGRLLYVVEAGVSPRAIRVFDVVDDGRALANNRVFVQCAEGERPDGFRVDVDGNLWCGWGMSPELDGVRIINPAGKAIGHIHLPERCANLCFGGRNRDRLFMAASKSLYSVYVNTQGAVAG
jgi:gluconolactonase